MSPHQQDFLHHLAIPCHSPWGPVLPFVWHQSCLGVIGSVFSRPASPFLMKWGDLSWMRWPFWMLLTVVYVKIDRYIIHYSRFSLKMHGFFSKTGMEYGVRILRGLWVMNPFFLRTNSETWKSYEFEGLWVQYGVWGIWIRREATVYND